MDCTWPVDRTGCWAPPPALPGDATADQIAERAELVAKRAGAEAMAIDVLWALSGRQFGCLEVTARPCVDYAQGFGYRAYQTVLDGDMWMDVGCGCAGSCTITGPRVIHLPGPVVDVLEVVIGDIGLTDEDWQLEGDALYRTSGASWPRQNLGAPLGEQGTWSVKYQQGVPAPEYVGTLTASLANELVKACTEGEECRIPRNVVGASRRGVTYEFDPAKLTAAGKTWIPEIDMWLSQVNPNQLTAAPEVY